jgi:hypothetical protein
MRPTTNAGNFRHRANAEFHRQEPCRRLMLPLGSRPISRRGANARAETR